MKILLLSDTHSYLDEAILKYAREADEIWHAGDFGNPGIADKLAGITLLRGVYGNIDGHEIRKIYPLRLNFTIDGFQVFMTHIGGYPGKFSEDLKAAFISLKPNLFICGHSHILKITRDPQYENMICINPGAAGKSGFHQTRTMVRFEINKGKLGELEIIELGVK